MNKVIIGGSSSYVLAIKMARELNATLLTTDIKRFPDGEKYVRIEGDLNDADAVVVQSMYLNPDEYLMEYFLMVEALKDSGAKKVTGVIPYFAYARQDKRFNPGEAVSLKTVSKLIETVGTDQILTVDMHLHRVDDMRKIFKIPAKNLTAIPDIARYIGENLSLQKPLIIGPDEEAEQWAKLAAEQLETEYDVLEKKRLSSTEVEITTREIEVKNRDVVIIDDIISTGGTIAKTIEALKKKNAKKIVAACTHPVLVDNALKKIYNAGAYTVIGTTTIPSPISVVEIAGTLAKALT
ncbi:MAG: ribose-phosphate diphosphokinase [Candidatus Freyarchaeota archaeon]|nr:ribose-phosphate diphosphokinase [Candidatus Jordarchaeia archaeon]MBS7267396.1 ribose-phosphate diphosphokinase [Candidatus Jordarchaeia archaeon]MBS7278701.1 ribose-phosphate diphosphokinase [Candidatus Jordarchaeia archaeon]